MTLNTLKILALHAILAIAIQIVVAAYMLTFNTPIPTATMAGALAASSWFVSREFKEAQIRTGNGEAFLPVFAARIWSRQTLLEWIVPILVTIAITCLVVHLS